MGTHFLPLFNLLWVLTSVIGVGRLVRSGVALRVFLRPNFSRSVNLVWRMPQPTIE